MKKTLLNTALANMTGALALTIMVGSGVAYADENNASQGAGNLALQDFGNQSYNDNYSNNDLASHNDNDLADVDLYGSANGNLNHNLSGNTAASHNDNDGADIDVWAGDVANDKSHDDDDFIDADIMASDVGNDKSVRTYNSKHTKQVDASVDIGSVAMLVSTQQLVGVAALVEMSTYSGDISTGSISFGAETNKMFAGNMTSSNNTGAGSVAQAASSIQANGTFAIGAGN
jgi:hypothetical protein